MDPNRSLLEAELKALMEVSSDFARGLSTVATRMKVLKSCLDKSHDGHVSRVDRATSPIVFRTDRSTSVSPLRFRSPVNIKEESIDIHEEAIADIPVAPNYSDINQEKRSMIGITKENSIEHSQKTISLVKHEELSMEVSCNATSPGDENGASAIVANQVTTEENSFTNSHKSYYVVNPVNGIAIPIDVSQIKELGLSKNPIQQITLQSDEKTCENTEMDNFSSDGSADDEEVLGNFEEEAAVIVPTELPKKSSERYLLVYNNYKKWQEENKNSLSSNTDESNLIVYFNTLKGKLKPPTLWSIWSMLRSTLITKDNVNISNFFTLKSMLKTYSKGYKPNKSLTLNWAQIMKFMTTADDSVYLATKVILIFGICGALRCDELINIKVQDVEDFDDKFLVTIQHNQNEYPGQFVVGNLFYNKVKNYILLRPSSQFSDRFFIHYYKGRCTRQVFGKHKVGEVPETIASYLKLENAKKYTGHCFRRTVAMLLSECGTNMEMLKQLGRWRSDIITQGFIKISSHNRQLIYNGVIHAAKTTNTNSKPLTSTKATAAHEGVESNYNLNWSDISEDFTTNKSAFKNAVTAQPPPCKKRNFENVNP